jgi:hypothetical protein
MKYKPLKQIVEVMGPSSARDRRFSFLGRTITASVIVTSLLLAMPRPTTGCGPFFTDAIFVYTKHPDFPLERFAQGQLGVIRPTYARSYLFAAYRNLVGEALSAKENSNLQSLWSDRLSNGGEIDDAAWIKTWTEARKQVLGVNASEIRAFRHREKPHEYESYLNCQKDAFETAAATLNERIKRYTADSAEMRNWVAAQDTVFANCSEGQHIPEPLTGSADALVLADRAYQIAAANFYAGNFDAATKEFDEIARDRRSPWLDQAPYLAARSLVRKASLAEKEEAGKPALAEAETRLKSIQGGEYKFSSMDLAVARLSNLVRLRLHPEDKLHELAHSIVQKDASADFKQDVWDFTILLDRFLGDDVEETTKRPVPEALRQDDVTDWILNLQGGPADALPHSLERWGKTHSLPWLVAAMTNASGNTANLQLLLSAAERVDHASPAFASVAFHSVRLLTESGRSAEARQILDRILATDRLKLPSSAVNLLLSQRMALAQNLEEFLQSAQRVPAGFSDDSDGREIPEAETETKETTKGSQFFFDVDAANIFNKGMPLDVLREAALSRILAVNLRRDVAQAAFMRASLIDERDNAARLAALLGDLYPELKGLLTAYQHATTPDARRFAGAYLSLKFPGLRPYVTSGVGRSTPLAEVDSYRDNWWCAEPSPLSGPASDGDGADGSRAKAKRFKPPEFLVASQTTADKQSATLRALGAGPNYLCRTVIEWANKNPADSRAPEALHLAVKSTRYGCTDKETGRWSKAAFDLLHRRYPNSTWARQTKYWFKD